MADSELVLWATKGAPLTPTEVDGNFIWLDNRISAVLAMFGAVLNLDGTVKNAPLFYAEDSGGDDDYEATLAPAPAALSDLTGKLILLKPTTANADSGATFNPNSLGATAITKQGTVSLDAGDIKAGAVCKLVFDGTQFQLV